MGMGDLRADAVKLYEAQGGTHYRHGRHCFPSASRFSGSVPTLHSKFSRWGRAPARYVSEGNVATTG